MKDNNNKKKASPWKSIQLGLAILAGLLVYAYGFQVTRVDLEDINEKDGVTVLCSLHFLDLVHRYADRVVALNDGKLVFEGLPTEIDDQKFKDIYGRDAERIG